jgi:hypothetical protein
MPKLKPFGIGDVDDMVNAKNEFTNEVVPKGVYTAKVKRMTHGTIRKEGVNKGKSRFSILLEVTGLVGGGKLPAKYKGAGVWDGINVIQSGAGRANDFIDALAGEDPAKQKALRRSFWKPDIFVDGENQVKKIGRLVVGSPEGERVVVIKTKMGKDQDGNPRAEVASYMTLKSSESDDDVEDAAEEDDDDLEDDEDDSDEDDEDDEDEDDEDDDDDLEDADEDEDEDEDDDDKPF